MTVTTWKRLVWVLSSSALLAGCGSLTGSPAIDQVSGWVDSSCTAAPTTQDVACTVHLIVHNSGATGSGYASVGVPLNTAGGATAKPVQCTLLIPMMAQGDYTETTCDVVVPKGMIVPAPPRIVNLTVGATSQPADETSTLITVLAAFFVLNLLALVWLAIEMRRLRMSA